MRIYQSSLSYKTLEFIKSCRPDVKVNLLRSFDLGDEETFRLLVDFKDNIYSKILDSGVWSKYQDPKNYKHTVEDYAAFLSIHANKFDAYFNYDEDFKEVEKDNFSSKNKDNQRFLEKEGFKPIPVLHVLDDDEVEYYLHQKSKYSYVAIGSNAISNKRFKPTVKKFYDNGVKVHAFRIGSYKKLKDLHVYSSDCSSHAQWTAVGRCIFFIHSLPQEDVIAFLKYNKNGSINNKYFQWMPHCEIFFNYISNLANIEFNDLLNDSNLRTYSNSIYYWWLEKYITMEHIDNNIIFEDEDDFYQILNCFKRMLDFGSSSPIDELLDSLMTGSINIPSR